MNWVLLIAYGFLLNGLFAEQNFNPKTVAIIGGGPSGLVSAKEAKACGLCPTIFEKSSDFGGVWNPDTGKAWNSMRINNSRYSMVFSDHPWQEGIEDFPDHKAVYRYLSSYAERFHLREHALFNVCVSEIEKTSHGWRVEWVDSQNQKQSSLFNSVIVCSGFFARPFIPDIPGLKTFEGIVSHTQEYKSPDLFKDERVALIGNAFSGCEIAAEISTEASATFHIFRSAHWLFGRYCKLEDGRFLPFDCVWNRKTYTRQEDMTSFQQNQLTHSKLSIWCKKAMDASPDLAVLSSSKAPAYVATISDLYPSQIRKGCLQTELGFIERIEGQTLCLSNQQKIDVDRLVFATGYRLDLPFFNDTMKQLLDFDGTDPLQPLPLYKRTLHPDFPDMIFVGMSRFPLFFTIIELQARWGCLILSDQLPRPAQQVMRLGIEREKNLLQAPFKPQFLPLDGLLYYEDLAREIGALPDFEKMAKEDFDLYQKLWDGFFTSASYRLVGPGNNPFAALKIIEDLYPLTPDPLVITECSYSY